jgi:CDP-glycerol glycerophosphotransferase (TagB/SpsB family)
VIGSINDDIIATLSNLNTTVLNSCLGLTANQYCITGYPRNDYLYIEDGLQNLRKITGRDIKKKIILYMPTYKDNPDTEYNLFGFSKFDYNVFSNYLKENELFFMVKLHPNDEVKLRQKYDGFFDDNIFILDSSMLDKFELDLYQIINSVDLLITDYSSIYFDYLLLDRPIIFTPTDFDDYIKNRGILLEPYDFWTPGPKCLEQYNLQIEIIRLLDNKNYYSSERKTIKKLIHYYFDGKSTDRVIQLIIDKMDE